MDKTLQLRNAAIADANFTKDNERVRQFHEYFGAQRVGETEFDCHHRHDHSAIAQSRERFRRFLAEIVTV